MRIPGRIASVVWALALGIAWGCSRGPEVDQAPTDSAQGASAEPSPILLRSGSVLERTPQAQSREPYQLHLQQRHLLSVVAEQKGADVALRLLTPGGETAIRIDSPTGRRGEERLLFVAEQAGDYALIVEVGKVDPGGRYSLAVDGLRAAKPEEERAARTVLLFATAEEHRREGTRSSRQEALPLYRGAADRWHLAGDRVQEAKAWLQLAKVQDALGDAAGARASRERSLPLLEASGDVRQVAAVWLSLGEAASRDGAAELALDAFNHARAAAQKIEDRALVARALDEIARLFRAAGQLAKAEWAYEQAAALYREVGAVRGAALTLTNLASLYVEAAEPALARQALSSAEETLPIGTEAKDQAYLAQLHGQVDLLQEHEEDAARWLSRAVELYQGGDAPEGLEATLQAQARLALRQERWQEAQKLMSQVLASAEARADRPAAALARQNLGQVLLRRGDLERARALVGAALVESRDTERPALRAAALLGLAKIEREEGRLGRAWAYAAEALALVESLRTEAERRTLRLALLADTQRYFDLAVDILVERAGRESRPDLLAEALATSERGRARELVDRLRSWSEPNESLGQRARLEELRRQRERQRESLIESAAAPEELAAVERDLTAVVDQLAQVPAPDLSSLRPVAEPARQRPLLSGPELLRELQLRLPRGALLLEVDLGEPKSWLFAVDATGIAAYGLPPGKQLEALADEVSRAAGNSASLAAGGRPRALLDELGSLLLAPVADRLLGRHLLLVPDGRLWRVPWGALGLPHSAADQDLLAASEGHAYAPSALSFLEIAARGGTAPPLPPRVAIFADPRFRAEERASPSATPEGVLPEDLDGAAERRAGRGDLERLPNSAKEAEVLRELLPADHLRAFLRQEASKRNLLALHLDQLDVLHFATHGIVDPDEPSLSGLVLSLVNADGKPVDGFLRAHEIEALPLHPALVVLSACRTADGKEVRGEGVLSLSRAFFTAGAQRVLVTLWPVADEASAELIRRFYRGLVSEGLSPAQALRRAQLSLRQEPRWQAPYYWAGFVLQGDF